MATLSFSTKGDLVLLVERRKEHSNSEWSAFLDAASACMQKHGNIRVLVFTDGAGPNAVQRDMSLKAGWRNNPSPVAVVSRNFVVRGIVTALSWFNMNVKAFSPDDAGAAFAFLWLTSDEQEWARSETSRLKALLDPSP